MPEIIKIKDMEANFDHYLDRCEAGETFFIEHEDGKLVAMVPAKEFEDANQTISEYSYQTDHDDAC
jgi:antitoxin (DNA-binding transcriptional repressor) of toxin-antitoxin stability system